MCVGFICLWVNKKKQGKIGDLVFFFLRFYKNKCRKGRLPSNWCRFPSIFWLLPSGYFTIRLFWIDQITEVKLFWIINRNKQLKVRAVWFGLWNPDDLVDFVLVVSSTNANVEICQVFLVLAKNVGLLPIFRAFCVIFDIIKCFAMV